MRQRPSPFWQCCCAGALARSGRVESRGHGHPISPPVDGIDGDFSSCRQTGRSKRTAVHPRGHTALRGCRKWGRRRDKGRVCGVPAPAACGLHSVCWGWTFLSGYYSPRQGRTRRESGRGPAGELRTPPLPRHDGSLSAAAPVLRSVWPRCTPSAAAPDGGNAPCRTSLSVALFLWDGLLLARAAPHASLAGRASPRTQCSRDTIPFLRR